MTRPRAKDGSKVVKCGSFHWEGVDVRQYKDGGGRFKDVQKHVLLGEADGERALRFITRYFEIQPRGYSSLERHEHPHAVVIVRGHGKVLLGARVREVAPFDCVYVSPGDFHQFHAVGDEPLGFLCMVDRERDRPVLATPEDIDTLADDPEVRALLAGQDDG